MHAPTCSLLVYLIELCSERDFFKCLYTHYLCIQSIIVMVMPINIMGTFTVVQ